MYHNASMESDDGSEASTNVIESLVAKAKAEPSIFKTSEWVDALAA